MNIVKFVPEVKVLDALFVEFKTPEEQQKALEDVLAFIDTQRITDKSRSSIFKVKNTRLSPSMIAVLYTLNGSNVEQSMLISSGQYVYRIGIELKANFERNMKGWKKHENR